MTYQVALVANTWTEFTVAALAAQGIAGHFTITGETDIAVGRKATAATAGVAVPAGVAIEVVQKTGDTLNVWVRSVPGGKIKFEQVGAKYISLDATGTT